MTLRKVFLPICDSAQQHIYDKMWMINDLLKPSLLLISDFNIFYYHKKGEGGGQKVMIGIIISENVDNYGWPLRYYLHTYYFHWFGDTCIYSFCSLT